MLTKELKEGLKSVCERDRLFLSLVFHKRLKDKRELRVKGRTVVREQKKGNGWAANKGMRRKEDSGRDVKGVLHHPSR